jgi:hypothetical protein
MLPLLHFLCWFWFLASFALADSKVTIYSMSAYSTLRKCVQSCLYGGCNAAYVDTGCLLGCGQDLVGDYLDSCYCRTDLALMASSLISSCATAACSPSPGPDASAAVSLYADYCHVVFPTTTPAASTITLGPSSLTSALTSGGPQSPASTAVAPTISILTTTVISVTTEASNSGTSGGSSLSRSDTIAVVMGVLAVLSTALAAFLGRRAIVRVVQARIGDLHTY